MAKEAGATEELKATDLAVNEQFGELSSKAVSSARKEWTDAITEITAEIESLGIRIAGDPYGKGFNVKNWKDFGTVIENLDTSSIDALAAAYKKLRDESMTITADVEAFNKFMAAQSGKDQDATALGKLAGMFRPVITRYMDLSEDDRYTVRDYVRKFTQAYAFITQLVRLHDRDLFSEYQYTLHLIRLLPRVGSEGIGNIEDKIKLEYASLTTTFTVIMPSLSCFTVSFITSPPLSSCRA